MRWGQAPWPPLPRIVIVTEVVDDASEKIKVLIEQDARQTPEFGRISICQNLVIDPDRPEAAEVFAVPMDEGGRRSFIERLQGMFPNRGEEGRSNPDLVTQRSEVGQVAVFRGAEAAPLGDPPFPIRQFIANREPEPPAFIFGPAGVILSILGLRLVNDSPPGIRGREMAIAGIALGSVTTVLYFILYFARNN